MKKSVLILENSSKFYWGGGQQVTMMVIKILKEVFSEIYLADYKSEMLFPQLVKEYIDKSHIVNLIGKCYKNPITHNESRWLELFVSLVTLPINTIKLLRFCKKKGLTPDNTVVYCTTKKVLLLAYVLSVISKYKYIYHSHMVISGDGLGRKILDTELRSAEMNICVSKTVKNSININNTRLIYNALEINHKPSRKEHERFIVSVVGSIVPIKGFDVFVDSYKYIKHHEIEYRVYGAGYMQEDLQNQIDTYKPANIRLMGFQRDILKELEMTDVIVVPTIIEEACPLVVIQSFLLGIPCIATNIGGQAENIADGENGFLVPVGDSEAIAEKINYLFENPDEYKKISLKSHETYSKFTFEKFKVEILDVFRSI